MHRKMITMVLGPALLWLGLVAEARDQGAGARVDSVTTAAGAKAAASVMDPLVDWPQPAAVQHTGLLRASFTSSGAIGWGLAVTTWSEDWPPVNFEVPANSGIEYLFGGVIWVGGIVNGDTLVSTGADGWSGVREMYPDYPFGGVTKVESPADRSFRAEFTDTNTTLADDDYYSGRPHQPLNIRVANRSHAWRSSPNNVAIIYDMVITNIGVDVIEDGYVGFFVDADVYHTGSSSGGYTDDVAGSVQGGGTAYIIDNDGDLTNPGGYAAVPRAFCLRMLDASVPLADVNFNWWISNGEPTLDFGPRMKPQPGDPYRDFGTGGTGTPVGDANKYYVLRHREWDYDQIFTGTIAPDDTMWLLPPQAIAADFADGFDARFLISYGPFDLAPGQSERLVWATFTTDSIHVDPANAALNLPNNPAAYLANLDFTSMTANSAVVDALKSTVLDPLTPPIGLRELSRAGNDITVAWDPWCYDDVIFYNVYAAEVDPLDLPDPGVAAPWLTPDEWTLVGVVGGDMPASFTLTDLPTDRFYMVTVAHQTDGGEGAVAPPIFIRAGDRAEGPSFGAEYLFFPEGAPVEMAWTPAAGGSVDHYNLYRFGTPALAAKAYHAFYDSGFAALTMPPMDSFLVGESRYYYYAMTPYVTLPAGMTSFTDLGALEGNTYLVTAVDTTGLESYFSAPIEVVRTPVRDKDILVMTHGTKAGSVFMDYPDVQAFYDSVLTGYAYDLYSWADSNALGITTDWHLLMEYRLVIIDDDLTELVMNKTWETETKAYTRYLLSGGRLAYFGSFANFTGLNIMTGELMDTAIESPFLSRFFGIDSIRFVPAAALFEYVWPYKDTLYGFNQAEAVTGDLPFVTYDQSRRRINPGTLAQRMWPSNAPLSVTAFVPGDSGEVTHLFGADPTIESLFEGLPVGVRTFMDSVETYAFGFHLWYMEAPGAAALIGALIDHSVAVQAEPDTIVIGDGWVVSPGEVEIRIGNLPGGRTVYEIDVSSVLVAGALAPSATAFLSGLPGFDGDALALTVSGEALVDQLGAMYGTRRFALPVIGTYAGGEPFALSGSVVIVGRAAGDFSGDGAVEVTDLVYLVDYMFRGADPDRAPVEFDANGDCVCTIVDVTAMVAYLFRGGAAPVWCGE